MLEHADLLVRFRLADDVEEAIYQAWSRQPLKYYEKKKEDTFLYHIEDVGFKMLTESQARNTKINMAMLYGMYIKH